MKKEILAVIQVRMSSSRLPGKAMLEINGKPTLWWVIRQLKASKTLTKIIVATTTMQEDDAIEGFCLKESIPCYRGSLDDIVDRIYNAAKKYRPYIVVRVTADDIFKDPEHIDYLITKMIGGDADVVVNNQPPSYPYGMDLDIVNFTVLEETWRMLKDNGFTGGQYVNYICGNNRYKVLRIVNDVDLSQHRWSIDSTEDYNFAINIINKLVSKYPDKNYFNMEDILFVEKQEFSADVPAL